MNNLYGKQHQQIADVNVFERREREKKAVPVLVFATTRLCIGMNMIYCCRGIGALDRLHHQQQQQ